jgi:aldehyde dehydrogenase (NAD+)
MTTMTAQVPTQTPARYSGFTQQFIGGSWREGRSTGDPLTDRNPFDGEMLTRLRGASVADVADAFASAEGAHPGWAAASPRERAAILRRAADIVMARRDEIVDMTIREVGAWARR